MNVKQNITFVKASTTLTLMASFKNNVAKPVPECQTILDFAAARDADVWCEASLLMVWYGIVEFNVSLDTV